MSGPIFVLNGPNLDLLGAREPHVYGSSTLADLERKCLDEARSHGVALVFRQTNAEHEMIGWLHEARTSAAGIVVNPAGFSYHAVPVLDALRMCDCPIIEVHITNIHRREAAWRAESIMTSSVTGLICGLGVDGYPLAIRHLARQLVPDSGRQHQNA